METGSEVCSLYNYEGYEQTLSILDKLKIFGEEIKYKFFETVVLS